MIEKLDKLWLNVEHNYELPKQTLWSRVHFETTKSQTQSRNYEQFIKPESGLQYLLEHATFLYLEPV